MDLLKVTGVDSKGYGKVYKHVMRNPQIPLCAKALYAYLCSYAGNGTIAFPKREKVMRDLQLAKNTFTKHLGVLVDAKYISRTQTPAGNIYEILMRIPDKDGTLVEVKGKGYGTVPKLTMLDRRLTAQAKGVYAYFCSYAGAGNSAYPHRGTILRELNIGTDAYYRHYKSLVDLGYITPVQGTKDNGQFTASTYHLNDYLDVPQAKKTEQVERGSEKPHNKADSSLASQKPGHGEHVPVSQKSGHGQKPHSNAESGAVSQKHVHGETVENFFEENPASQKEGYGKPACGFLRHPYTNNTPTINIPSSYEEGKAISNIAAPSAPDDQNPTLRPEFSKQQVNDAICYHKLVDEALAWTSLKDTLGHFPDAKQRKVFADKYLQIIRECAVQLHNFLLRKSPTMIVDGKTVDLGVARDRLIARMDFETMNELCVNIAERQKEIRNIKQYVRKTVINLATQECVDMVLDTGQNEP